MKTTSYVDPICDSDTSDANLVNIVFEKKDSPFS